MNGTVTALIVIPIAISIGQLMFKAASRTAGGPSVLNALGLFANPWFVAAVALYALATIAWIFVLRHVPVGRAYLFMSLSFVAVPLGAWLAFGEPLGLRHAVGIAVIIAGIIISSS